MFKHSLSHISVNAEKNKPEIPVPLSSSLTCWYIKKIAQKLAILHSYRNNTQRNPLFCVYLVLLI